MSYRQQRQTDIAAVTVPVGAIGQTDSKDHAVQGKGRAMPKGVA